MINTTSSMQEYNTTLSIHDIIFEQFLNFSLLIESSNIFKKRDEYNFQARND